MEAELMFRNSRVQFVALQDIPKMNLVGLTVGPFKQGETYTERFWVAACLERAGVVALAEEYRLSFNQLSKIHWLHIMKEEGRLPPLPQNFYFLCRHLLQELSESIDSREEYLDALSFFESIIEIRTREIVNMALMDLAKPPEELTEMEKAFYLKIRKDISLLKNKLQGKMENERG